MMKYFLMLVILIGGILIINPHTNALVCGINAQTTAVSRTENANITPGPTSLVYVVPIKGAIMDRGLAYFIRHSVEQAKEENAALIIFEIDTPGGAVGEGEEYTIGICNSIDRASPISTVAYITHWAWSAGSLISISADKIIMKQTSSIGSAEVIAGSGNESIHQEKYTSALRAEFKARAEKKGYSTNLAMAMVDKEMEVREVLVDGVRQFLTPEEIKEAYAKNKSVEDIGLVIAKGKLLNLTAKDALKYGLASAIKEDRSEIPPVLGVNNFRFKEITPTWSEYLVMYLTSPVVAGILILAGLIAAGMSLKMPGMGIPEAIAIICFGLVFFGHYLVGMAEFTEILIFMLGIGLLSVEIFLLPGFGVFGISGIVLIFISLILSMQGFTIPDVKGAPWQLETLQRNFIVVGLSFSLAVITFMLFVRYLSSVPFFNHLVLSADENTDAGFVSTPMSIGASFLGKKGIVFTALRPVGKITILDSAGKETNETIDAVTEGDFINKGEIVVVIDIDGSRIVVERTSRPVTTD
ncbi:MAG: NfeD family protein [Planctomycetota bacterium]